MDGAPDAEEPGDEEENVTGASIADKVDTDVTGGDEPPRRRAEPLGGYKTPVCPTRKRLKQAARARAKAWILERRKARPLGGKGMKHGGGADTVSAASALDSITGSIAEEEGDSASWMEGNQDDAGGPPAKTASKPEPSGGSNDSGEEMITIMTFRFSIPGDATVVVQGE